MRTFLLSLMALLLLAAPALALETENMNFYVQGIFALPLGDFGDFAGSGFGGGLGIRVPYNDVLSFRGEAGYIAFGKKDYEFPDFPDYNYEYSYSMIPIMALGEYFFTADRLFYGLGGVGLTMLRASVDYKGDDDSPFLYDDTVSNTEFTISLGAGYAVNEHISIEGRYNLISDANQVTIHGVIHF